MAMPWFPIIEAGRISVVVSNPATANVLRTRETPWPLAMRRSDAQPATTAIAASPQNGSDPKIAVCCFEKPRSRSRYAGSHVRMKNQA